MLNLVDQHLLEVQVVLLHQEVPLGLFHLQSTEVKVIVFEIEAFGKGGKSLSDLLCCKLQQF